jgi:hypothetical protein
LNQRGDLTRRESRSWRLYLGRKKPNAAGLRSPHPRIPSRSFQARLGSNGQRAPVIRVAPSS